MSKSTKTILGAILICFAIGVFSARIYRKIELKQHVTGILKHAADANSIELAGKELDKVLEYLRINALTTGSTHVFYDTPEEDIEFWFTNIEISRNELTKLEKSTSLEKTNALLKLRETLMDGGEKAKVTVPPGREVFPHNRGWFFASFLAFGLFFLGLVWVLPASAFEMPSATE